MKQIVDEFKSRKFIQSVSGTTLDPPISTISRTDCERLIILMILK